MRHINIRSSLLVMLFLLAASMTAQTPRKFLVKEVGEKPVILHDGKKKVHVASRDLLPINAMITIPKGGKLVVYDHTSLRELTIKEAGTNVLAKFLDGSSKESYTKVTFAGLIALLFSNDKQQDAIGTIYRGHDSNGNSIDEYTADIRTVLADSLANIPSEYTDILKEVLEDIECQCEVPSDTITNAKQL